MPYSPSGTGERAEGAVSTTSTPTSKKASCMLGDDVGPGEHEHLVAALEVGAAEVVGGQVLLLDVRAEGAVVDDDPLVDASRNRLRPSNEATG